jgi:hypothetical protein
MKQNRSAPQDQQIGELSPISSPSIDFLPSQRILTPVRIMGVLLIVLFMTSLEWLIDNQTSVFFAPFLSLFGMSSRSAIHRTSTSSAPHNFSRHAILMSGMATRSGMECWEGLMQAFVDGEGRWQDVYAVLALGGEGTGPPTEEEEAVIDFYSSQPNVVAVVVDTTPFTSFAGTRMASVMKGAPYHGRTTSWGDGKTVSLMMWKTFLSWELMENVTRASRHKYDMIVRVRPDIYLPTYAWGGASVNLDEFSSEGVVGGMQGDGGGNFQEHPSSSSTLSSSTLESLGCLDSLYYRSWDIDDVVPEGLLSQFQTEVTGGHASPLLPHPPPQETKVWSTVFFPFAPICCGGINDYFAWGKTDAMREYFGTALRMDDLIGPASTLQLSGEIVRKYGLLAGLREEEGREGRLRGSFLLELRPCDKAVYCLVKWYANSTVDPNTCPKDSPQFRWEENVQSA